MAGLSFDVGMNVAGVRQGAEEIKHILGNLRQEFQLAEPSENLPPVADSGNSGKINQVGNSNGGHLLLVSKDQVKELVLVGNNLIQALREFNPNNPANPNRTALDKDSQEKKKKDAEILKNFFQEVSIAAGTLVGYEQYQTTQSRKRMKQMQADPYGAEMEQIQGNAQLTNTVVSTVGAVVGIAVGAATENPVIGALVSNGISQLIGNVTGAVSQRQIAQLQEQQMKVEMFKKRLDVMDESALRFGGNMWDVQSSLLTASRNTGMDIDQFMNLANSASSYGVTGVGRAGQLAKAAANTNRYTGANSGSVMNYLGTQERYGGNAIANMNYAYSAAIASGLTRNQFGEFLDGLQSVIENGISKGYVKSTKEVSDTMVMFDKLSGGSKFWQGEQGFNRLNQINNGLAGATALGNNAQILAYQALSDTMDPIDTFKIMEKGLSVNTFKKIAGRFRDVFGGDSFSEIQAWKELTGLNYTGASQLYQMAHGDLNSITEGQLKQLQANPETSSEKTYVKDSLNTISVQVAAWGSKLFPEYLTLLRKIADEPEPGADVKQVGSLGKGKIDLTLGTPLLASSELAVDDYLMKKGKIKKEWLQNPDFKARYDDILKDSVGLISNSAYVDYANHTNDPGYDPSELSSKAMAEQMSNQERLNVQITLLKELVELQKQGRVIQK